MRLARLLPFLAATAAAACSDSTAPIDEAADIAVTPVAQSVAAGTTAQFTLSNATSENLWYNLCGQPLERRVTGLWIEIPTSTACLAVVFTLRAGETTVAGYSVPADLSAGEYRLKVTFGPQQAGADPIIRKSGTFTVTR
jgi:hypothetical protein